MRRATAPVAAVVLAGVVFAAAALLSAHPPVASDPVWVERTLYLMGTRATLGAESADRLAALRQLEQMASSMERTEATLSTWRTHSELSRLNRHPVGQTFHLGPAVCALWPRLTRWYAETDGAFDPGVGALIEAWGLRDGGRRPSRGELAAARAVTGLAHFAFEPAACRVTRRTDATLDAGGFGKGEALRRLDADLPSDAVWRVDLGGQVAVSGRAAVSGRWPVAIAHPVTRDEPVMDVLLVTGSLATSGASERSFEVDGEPVSHILDSRTGQALHRPGSVTVWHEDPLVADMLSTALWVMGADAGMRFAESRGLAALFLSPSAQAEKTPVAVRPTGAFAARFPTVAATVPPTVPSAAPPDDIGFTHGGRTPDLHRCAQSPVL